MRTEVKYGEGLVGQSAFEKQMIILNDVPQDYWEIESGLGEKRPNTVVVVPMMVEEKTLAVFELASFHKISENERGFFKEASQVLALIINTIMDKKRTRDLLAESEALGEELKTQSDELRVSNEQLEEKTRDVEEQKDQLEKRNKEIEKARTYLQEKTNELESAVQYKSDFLSNMSHELRTPLNSLLLLSQMLLDEDAGNLNQDQVESLEVIHKSGQDLLQLINDILDLSKVEAGKLLIEQENVSVEELVKNIREQFAPVAKSKNFPLRIEVDPEMPGTIQTDRVRVEQILKNLLSNAFKFTEKGAVALKVYPSVESVAFEVVDTGTGIPSDQIEVIFSAFHQLDSSISRKYGGTGLGLTISRRLADLLDGEITCKSELGKGSAFTLYIPFQGEKKVSSRKNTLLLIEDDMTFAGIIQKIASEKGYVINVADTGERGITLAQELLPEGVILDLGLSDMDGLEVLEKLKKEEATRHIPVHILSGKDLGRVPQDKTIGVMSKPITSESIGKLFRRFEREWKEGSKRILIVENDETCSRMITDALREFDVQIVKAASFLKAKETLTKQAYDCIILDIGLPDGNGMALLEHIKKTCKKMPFIVVYTGRELTNEEYQELRLFVDSVILKDGKSLEHLQNEISLFLQAIKDKGSESVEEGNFEELKGHKVLLVDDDMRNTISLVKVLGKKQVEVVTAENGLEGIKKLTNDPSIELVIMDIMMPVMNGLEAIKEIRSKEAFRDLPIVALTAKAMAEDGLQCIQAGANDYLTKPVELKKLLSIMNVWLSTKKSLKKEG